jgi:hypothetical protein
MPTDIEKMQHGHDHGDSAAQGLKTKQLWPRSPETLRIKPKSIEIDRAYQQHLAALRMIPDSENFPAAIAAPAGSIHDRIA